MKNSNRTIKPISQFYYLKNSKLSDIPEGSWFTPNSNGVVYNSEQECVHINRKSNVWNYQGSFEMKVPLNALNNMNSVKIIFSGKGWFSFKVIEKTVDGPIMEYHGKYKKLQSVREVELFSTRLNEQKDSFEIPFTSLYNKPFNVSLQAFIKGFKKINPSNIVSAEITVRRGEFKFYEITFF